MEVPGIGYLQGNPGDSVRPLSTTTIHSPVQVKQGTKLELPLWLAEMLVIRSVRPLATR
jgi:hypothetical protein